MTGTGARDHGGGIDAAIAQYGGARDDWLDLSTGINPVPYPVNDIPANAYTELPDHNAMARLLAAARKFWSVPDNAAIVAGPGASALISRMPDLTRCPGVYIPRPTYNEHAAAFSLAGVSLEDGPQSKARVFVHPNNPDGQLWGSGTILGDHKEFTVIDESFCDVVSERSHIACASEPGFVILKSFGKFWGLAGLRLGFAIGTPHSLARQGCGSDDLVDLAEILGPWAVSGPALEIGARALEDTAWANATRARLATGAERLDGLLHQAGAKTVGGTTLFRLYQVDNAAKWQRRLARGHVWTRVFPYSENWLRLGLPAPDRWQQLEAAL